MYSRVLIPLDELPSAEGAIEEALEMAPIVRSVHLAYLESPFMGVVRAKGFGIYADRILKHRMTEGRKYLETIREKLESAGLEVTISLHLGRPLAVLPKLARDKEADLILLGGQDGGWTRGDTGFAHLASRLSHEVDIPVIAVQGVHRQAA